MDYTKVLKDGLKQSRLSGIAEVAADKPLTPGLRMWVPDERIPVDVCNKILESSSEDFGPGTVVNKDGPNQESPIRKTKVHFGNQQWVYDLVWPYMQAANLNADWHFNISAAEDYQIGKYEVGMFYGVHLDGSGTWGSRRIDASKPNLHNKARKLSMTVLLNDDYEGGDLNLFGYENLKKEIGTMCFFPSFMPHEVTPVTKGTRYSLVMWFVGRPWY